MTSSTRVISLLLLLLWPFSSTATEQQLDSDPLIEPWTATIPSVVSKEDCAKIIAKAEEIGFPENIDSIDADEEKIRKASWSMDIYMDKELFYPELEELYKPYLERLKKIVSEKKIEISGNDTEPTLDWVFLRKYSADNPRRDLKIHHDINTMSVNIALNDDFEGDGYFYLKPKKSFFEEGNPIPAIPEEMETYEYLAKANLSDPSFAYPKVNTGDVFIHNFTVYHGIAPIEKGTRYALLLFYDTDHPGIEGYQDQDVTVMVWNYYFDAGIKVDLYEIDLSTQEMTRELIMEDLEEEFEFSGVTGERYEIRDKETGEVLEQFDLEADVDYVEDAIKIGPDSILDTLEDDDEDEIEDEEFEDVLEDDNEEDDGEEDEEDNDDEEDEEYGEEEDGEYEEEEDFDDEEFDFEEDELDEDEEDADDVFDAEEFDATEEEANKAEGFSEANYDEEKQTYVASGTESGGTAES